MELYYQISVGTLHTAWRIAMGGGGVLSEY